jgi:hypothetical protein
MLSNPLQSTLQPPYRCFMAAIGADLQQVLGEIGRAHDRRPNRPQGRKTTSELLSSLAQLELMGLITLLPGMRYQRR